MGHAACKCLVPGCSGYIHHPRVSSTPLLHRSNRRLVDEGPCEVEHEEVPEEWRVSFGAHLWIKISSDLLFRHGVSQRPEEPDYVDFTLWTSFASTDCYTLQKKCTFPPQLVSKSHLQKQSEN